VDKLCRDLASYFLASYRGDQGLDQGQRTCDFVVDEVALEKVFLRVLTFSLVSIILPVLRIPLDLNIQNHF
jgi:hypothetical protein